MPNAYFIWIFLYFKNDSFPALNNADSEPIFTGANQVADKLSGVFFFGLVNLTPVCLTFPPFVYTAFNYLTTDSKRDAFNLPFPMW